MLACKLVTCLLFAVRAVASAAESVTSEASRATRDHFAVRLVWSFVRTSCASAATTNNVELWLSVPCIKSLRARGFLPLTARCQ